MAMSGRFDMPQSTAALRQKAEALRLLRSPQATAAGLNGQKAAPARTVWAKQPHLCQHGTCLALEVRSGALWVRVRDTAGQEAWAPVARVLAPEQRRTWAKVGFG